jgi:hypothetical protein
MITKTSLLALGLVLGGTGTIATVAAAQTSAPALPGIPEQQPLPGLVNVNLENIRAEIAKDLDIDLQNVPINIQLPVAVAANVCGVDVAAIQGATVGSDTPSCNATNTTIATQYVTNTQSATGDGTAAGASGGSDGASSGGSGSTDAGGDLATGAGTETPSVEDAAEAPTDGVNDTRIDGATEATGDAASDAAVEGEASSDATKTGATGSSDVSTGEEAGASGEDGSVSSDASTETGAGADAETNTSTAN